MNDNVLYEMVVEKNHLNLIKQSLSLQINNLYEAVDADVVNTEKAYEDIKVLSDMLAVLRGSTRKVKQLCGCRTHSQTSHHKALQTCP